MDAAHGNETQLASAGAPSSHADSTFRLTWNGETVFQRSFGNVDRSRSAKRRAATSDNDSGSDYEPELASSSSRPKSRARTKRVKQSSSSSAQSSSTAAAASSSSTAASSSNTKAKSVVKPGPKAKKPTSTKRPAAKKAKAKSKSASSGKAGASTSTSTTRASRASTSKVKSTESGEEGGGDDEDDDEQSEDESDEDLDVEDDEDAFDSEAEAEEEEDLIAIADDHDAAFDNKLAQSRTISIPAGSEIFKTILDEAAAAGISNVMSVMANMRHDKVTEGLEERVCLEISQELWWSVAKKALDKYRKDGEEEYNGPAGRHMPSYRSRAVVLMNWGTLEEAAGEIVNNNNSSFTAKKLEELGLTDPKLVRARPLDLSTLTEVRRPDINHQCCT